MSGVDIEIVGSGRYDLGECPVWDHRSGLLYWADGLRGAVHAATPSGDILQTCYFGEAVGSFCLTGDGHILAACETGLIDFDPANDSWKSVFHLGPSAKETRLNDGKVAPDGSFVFGSMDRREKEPLGAAFRLSVDRRVEQIASGFVVFNGPCWSPDGTRFYASDSGAGQIVRYDFVEGGPLSESGILTSTDRPLEGSFDGSAVDEDGYIWSARIFGGRLTRLAPDGQIDREVELPVKKPTSLCFGGPDLSVLFVTSMGAQLLPEFPPDGALGGAVLAVRGIGVRGLPVGRFSG